MSDRYKNELIFKAFIAEQKAEFLTVEWVLWMLDVLRCANSQNAAINPDYLRARGVMIYPSIDRSKQIIEPKMIHKCHD